jgi:hypothetical protein
MRRIAAVVGVGIAALFALAGCGALTSAAKAPGATSTVTRGSDATTTFVPGDLVPSTASASVPLPSPTAMQPSLPSLPPVPTASPTVADTEIPSPCGYRQPGGIDGVTTVPGPGTLTVTWWHPGDPTVRSYRVAAVSQQLRYGPQPEPNWVTLTPTAGCRAMTATLTGLARGSAYVVWVDAVSKTPLGTVTEELMVGRSSVVTTT